MLYADLADTPPAGHRPAEHVGVRYENLGAHRRYTDPADLLSRQREVDPRSIAGAIRCRTDASTRRGASVEADMNEQRNEVLALMSKKELQSHRVASCRTWHCGNPVLHSGIRLAGNDFDGAGLLWGAYVLVGCILALMSAFRARSHHRWSLLIEDIVGIGAGIATLIKPPQPRRR
jgi:hypothetical protein